VYDRKDGQDLLDRERVVGELSAARPDVVIHLAAETGVRHGYLEYDRYVRANVLSTLQLQEICNDFNEEFGWPRAMIVASTSAAKHQKSYYGASKRAMEEMLKINAGVPVIVLRLFTVLGPGQRKNMFLYEAWRKLREGSEIQLYDYGLSSRYYSHVDDVCQAIVHYSSLVYPESFDLIDVGGQEPVQTLSLVCMLADRMNKPPKLKLTENPYRHIEPREGPAPVPGYICRRSVLDMISDFLEQPE